MFSCGVGYSDLVVYCLGLYSACYFVFCFDAGLLAVSFCFMFGFIGLMFWLCYVLVCLMRSSDVDLSFGFWVWCLHCHFRSVICRLLVCFVFDVFCGIWFCFLWYFADLYGVCHFYSLVLWCFRCLDAAVFW